MNLTMTVFEVVTDAGVTGVATSWLPGSPHEIGETAHHFLRPCLIGADPFERNRIWHEMMSFTTYLIPPKAASHIDIALWDIAGKATGLPIHKLLGGNRDRMPVYATMSAARDAQHQAAMVKEARDSGLRGAKLKMTDPDVAADEVAAAREAVGSDFSLMLDATGGFHYQDAVRVGRILERHGYEWYEDPINVHDIDGYQRLSDTLDIPVIMGEFTMGGPWALGAILRSGAADALRGIADAIGGITGRQMIGQAAEVMGRRLEPHSYGSTLVQAAHFHYMLSSRNNKWFEMPFPRMPLDYGMKTVIDVTSDGFALAPTAPGLGYEVDWDTIDNDTIAEYR